MAMEMKDKIDQLNSFLRGEISAVETYRMALEKIEATSPARAKLESCKASHQDRVEFLRGAIAARGGEPSATSGPWGVFAKAVEGSSKLFGDKAAIAALEEGEDHGLKEYRELEDLDVEARQLVVTRLLPLQEQTHLTMSLLKQQLSS